MKPLAYDFYCGLGGWTEGLLSAGFDVIGFDIERHDYGTGGYPAQLVLQDVRTIHGAQLIRGGRIPSVLVASPPCQKYSYMAMPWKKAKALAAWYRESPERIAQLNELFDACFRIQREACEAAGRHIPLIVENVRGAQPWVGRSAWNFGSYHLWGDVPALMPIPVHNRLKGGQTNWRDHDKPGYIGEQLQDHFKVPGFRFDGRGKSFQSASVKITGQDWSNYAKTGKVSPHWRMELLKQRDEAAKGNGSWFGNYKEAKAAGRGSANRYTSSNSIARKAASAQIAKIPFPLALHIAKTFATCGAAAHA